MWEYAFSLASLREDKGLSVQLKFAYQGRKADDEKDAAMCMDGGKWVRSCLGQPSLHAMLSHCHRRQARARQTKRQGCCAVKHRHRPHEHTHTDSHKYGPPSSNISDLLCYRLHPSYDIIMIYNSQ